MGELGVVTWFAFDGEGGLVERQASIVEAFDDLWVSVAGGGEGDEFTDVAAGQTGLPLHPLAQRADPLAVPCPGRLDLADEAGELGEQHVELPAHLSDA